MFDFVLGNPIIWELHDAGNIIGISNPQVSQKHGTRRIYKSFVGSNSVSHQLDQYQLRSSVEAL